MFFRSKMLRFSKLFLTAFVIAAVTSLTVTAQEEDEMFTSDNKVDCVNKMVDWCDKMKYPQNGTGMAMVSIAVTDDSGKFWRVFCASDSDGTNCTRNRIPWFSCSSEHKLTYNGVSLKKDSTDGVDDEICNTTKTAFNDIFIQNLSYNPTNVTREINKGLEQFFEAIADLQEQFDMLRDRIFNPFFNRFPFDDSDSSTELPDSSTPEDTNQLERE